MGVHELIAAISPDVYCDPNARAEVKKLVKEKGYLEASKKAKPIKDNFTFNYDEANKNPLSASGLSAPVERHELIYDSPSEGLEQVYFWILDFLNAKFEVEKIKDNFISSPGSGHFSELAGKATRMQEEAIKILSSVNTVIKSILSIIYDLKEFKLRLKIYDDLQSKDEKEKSAALLSLKQIWMDQVDFVKRGTTSLKQMAAQFDYATLIDAFMVSKDLDQVNNLDLNNRVKRILEQRISDFNAWVSASERELRKRYDIERNYLKSQVASLKLYTRWLKPYLEAAQKLEQNPSSMQSSLVTAFSTIVLDLMLLAKGKYSPEDDVDSALLPDIFKKVKTRKYIPLVIVEFSFRGIPQRVGQQYAFGGRSQITFTGYALNEQELEVLKKELDNENFSEVLKLIEGTTSESLERIEEDLKEFLEEETKEEEKKKESEDVNPFMALFSFAKPKKKEEKKPDLSKGIKPDNSYEKVIRSQAIIKAREECFGVFDKYKKANRMPTHGDPFDRYT